MKKGLVLLIALALIGALTVPAMAQIRFKDVPDNHWAAKYVYDIVRMGITTGFPDGTFRGNKMLSRYETAVWLSKMAVVVDEKLGLAGGSDYAALKKAQEELKAELARVKSMVRSPVVKGGPGISGSLAAAFKAGSLLTTGTARGPVVDYRLKATLAETARGNFSGKVGLDTLDAGYGVTTGTRDNIVTLFDAEAKIRGLDLGLGTPVDVVLTAGPGPVVHTDASNILIEETGRVYLRPYNSIGLAAAIGGVDLSGTYTARGVDMTTNIGRVNINQLTGAVGLDMEIPSLGMTNVVVTGDYLKAGSTTDLRGQIEASARPQRGMEVSALINLGGSQSTDLAIGGTLTLTNYFKTGTDVMIKALKVGGNCRSVAGLQATESTLLPLTVFDKVIADGTMSIGGEIAQEVSDKVTLKGKGDLTMIGWTDMNSAGASMTIEGGLDYSVAPDAVLNASYRIYQTKAPDNSSDIAQVGLIYSF